MSNETQSPASAVRPQLRWASGSGPAGPQGAPAPAAAAGLHNFLGGSPGAVFIRLLVVSLIVGALLMWLDIRPFDIFRAIERLVNRLWALGFDAVREIAAYILAGAAIVVPVWLVLRLMNLRGAR